MQAHFFAAIRRLASALTHRDFRLLWTGALGSSIGTWMQKVAQAWLIVTLTGSASAFFLGLDSLMGELPILLLTLVGGVIAADGIDHRLPRVRPVAFHCSSASSSERTILPVVLRGMSSLRMKRTSRGSL